MMNNRMSVIFVVAKALFPSGREEVGSLVFAGKDNDFLPDIDEWA
ncbi:MAG: hypothetical protein ACI9RU_000547 [Litorivivens sp.]|jgi:hypothetical protein